MDRQILNITANEQMLTVDEPIRISTNKVNYIEAHFTLGDNWSGYDSVRAVWFNDFNCISTVLDSLGNCVVPFEVMKRKGNVRVNLVGSISEDDVLTDRLTSYPVVAVIVDCTAQITGANTSPITPSEFEQFAAAVHEDAERAEQSASSAQIYAGTASNEAESAHDSAQSAHDDKIAIEQAIAEVIQQIEDFEQVQVVVNTLPPSSQATSDFTDGVLTLGIPQGVKGDTGNGIQSIAKTGTSGLVDTYTITFTDGQTTTFNVTNGAKGDTGNGIQSIAKTSTVGLVDTYTITYTNGTTTTFTVTNGEKGDKGDTGEVSLATLESLMPTDSASGSIASFPDGQAVFGAKSMKVTLEPIQDLHGYDKPWSGGNGANKWDEEWEQGIYDSTNGQKATGSGFIRCKNKMPVLPNTAYYYKQDSAYGELGRFCFYDADENFVGYDSGRAYVNNALTTPSNAYYITFYVSGTAYSNGIAINYPSTVTAYSPYSNICPISGHTECVTEVCGVNVFDKTAADEGYIRDTNGEVNGTLPYMHTDYISVVPNATYYVKTEQTNGGWGAWYDSNKTFISSAIGWINNTLTAPSNARYVRLTCVSNASGNLDTFAVNYPSTDTEYHAYDGNTYTTDLGRTVYGGSLDVVSGVLTVDRAMVDLGSLDWIKYGGNYPNLFYANDTSIKQTGGSTILGNAICSQYAICTETQIGGSGYTDGYFAIGGTSSRVWINDTRYTTASDLKTAVTGQTLVYELSTPQTYQLTPTEVATLLGDNNIWSDSGDIAVVYVADIQRYIDKKLS